MGYGVWGKVIFMYKQLVISPTKQYKNILKSKQRNQEKKIQEVPLYKRISNNACGTALCGEQ